jgi:hypothetical protein
MSLNALAGTVLIVDVTAVTVVFTGASLKMLTAYITLKLKPTENK